MTQYLILLARQGAAVGGQDGRRVPLRCAALGVRVRPEPEAMLGDAASRS